MPEAGPGRVLVRLRAGGICGSDLPSFLGRRNPFVDSLGAPGYPLHEVVGVTETGARIVGWAEGHKGLAEYFVAHEDQIVELDDELSDVEATVVQPLCTVLHQLDKVDVAGKRVAVVGQGPIGLALQPRREGARSGARDRRRPRGPQRLRGRVRGRRGRLGRRGGLGARARRRAARRRRRGRRPPRRPARGRGRSARAARHRAGLRRPGRVALRVPLHHVLPQARHADRGRRDRSGAGAGRRARLPARAQGAARPVRDERAGRSSRPRRPSSSPWTRSSGGSKWCWKCADALHRDARGSLRDRAVRRPRARGARRARRSPGRSTACRSGRGSRSTAGSRCSG